MKKLLNVGQRVIGLVDGELRPQAAMVMSDGEAKKLMRLYRNEVREVEFTESEAKEHKAEKPQAPKQPEAPKEPEAPVEDEGDKAPLSKDDIDAMLVKDIKAALDEKGVEYDPKSLKPHLGRLLLDAQ